MKKELDLVKEIGREIEKSGGKLYFVGGFVRDRLIGKDSKDIDVEIHGVSEEQLINILSKFGNVDKIGASFGIYLIKGVDVDFALPRIERQTGDRHTDFEVAVDPFIGTFGASKRRDFTMNAIMEDVLTGEIVDHFEGRSDIENGIIRMVDEETFKEDALRVLRAIQFSARFNFWIEENTHRIANQMNLHHLAKERVYEELRKGMTKGNPTWFVNQMKKFENVVDLLPSLVSLKAKRACSRYTLPINIAAMGMDLSPTAFDGLAKDFLQLKQERKKAKSCHVFFQEVAETKGNQENMLNVVSVNKGLLDEHEEELIHFLTVCSFKNEAELLSRALELKRNARVVINGQWLIQKGIKPSPSFAELLRRAEVLSWMELSEEDILKELWVNN